MKVQEFFQIYIKKIAIIAAVLIAVIFFFVFGKAKSGEQAWEVTESDEAVLTFSGVTQIGVHSVELEIDSLAEGLWIEKVYVEAGTKLQEGDKLLKFSQDSIAAGREEVEQAKMDAQLAFHAGEIEYEQSKITLRYDKERAVLENDLAKEVYDDTIEELDEEVEQAQKALDEANAKISEYEALVYAKSSTDPYGVKASKKIYDDNLAILTKKMDKYGFTWEQVVNLEDAETSSEQLKVLRQFYQVLEQNLEDYEQAQEEYDAAVTEATLNLQNLKLGLSSLEAELNEAKAEYDANVLQAKLAMEQKQTAAEHAQEDYVTKLEQAEAQYEGLQDAKDVAEERYHNYAYMVGGGYYYATHGGTVLQVMVSEEQTLNGREVILEYGNQEEVTVALEVEQKQISSIAVGDVAYIKTDEVGSFRGTVVEINPIPKSDDDAKPRYEVKVAFDDEADEVGAGMPVTVMFSRGGTADEEAN